MSERGISSAVIRRLPRYYRYLGELLENNVVRISSKELSIRMKVTASQIRQDLNNFGGFGPLDKHDSLQPPLTSPAMLPRLPAGQLPKWPSCCTDR